MEENRKKAGWSADRARKLDSPERRAALPPEETLLKLGLKQEMDFLDAGCGVGFFTLPAARIVGPDAKAYAADVSTEMLKILSDKAKAEGLLNITAVLSGEYDMKIGDGSVDFAFCCNVLHEINDQARFTRELARVLAPGGMLAVIEWKKKQGEKGPRVAERISPGELEDILGKSGFDGFEQKDVNTDLYAVVAKKTE